MDFYITRRLLRYADKTFWKNYQHSVISGIKDFGQTNYSAAKAAIIGATKALAKWELEKLPLMLLPVYYYRYDKDLDKPILNHCSYGTFWETGRSSRISRLFSF